MSHTSSWHTSQSSSLSCYIEAFFQFGNITDSVALLSFPSSCWYRTITQEGLLQQKLYSPYPRYMLHLKWIPTWQMKLQKRFENLLIQHVWTKEWGLWHFTQLATGRNAQKYGSRRFALVKDKENIEKITHWFYLDLIVNRQNTEKSQICICYRSEKMILHISYMQLPENPFVLFSQICIFMILYSKLCYRNHIQTILYKVQAFSFNLRVFTPKSVWIMSSSFPSIRP